MKLLASLCLVLLTGCAQGTSGRRSVLVLGFGWITTSTNAVADVVQFRTLGLNLSNLTGPALSAGYVSGTAITVKTNHAILDIHNGTSK